MSNLPITPSAGSPNRTAIASVVAIVTVIPAMLPAGLVVLIYAFFLTGFLGGHVSWIPYLHEIGLQWFPELLRGAIAGVIAIAVVNYFFKNADLKVIRIATLAFLSGIVSMIFIFSLLTAGLSIEIVGATGFIVGLGVGIWNSGQSQ